METENVEISKMEDYETIQQIGKGSFGATFLVLHNTQNNKYVLKKIPLAKQTEKFKRTAHQELNLMSKLNHPYIVEIKDAWIDKGTHLCVVTDYCEGGDMTEIMKKARGKSFSEEKLCKWMTQLLLAVDYLHSNRVVHGDLKCSNIFLTKENDIRLGDFGFAKLLNNEESAPSTVFNRKVVGTPPPNFLCPELLENIPYGYKSDMWSLGCCLFEIAAHQPAFKAPDMAGLLNKINRSLISPLPIVYSSTLRQIIKTMLRKTPEHRPTVENGSTPALLNINEDSLVVKKVDFTSYSPSVSNHSDTSSGKDISSDLSVSPKLEDSSDDLIPLNGENDENLVCIPEDSIDGDSGTCELDATACELTSGQGDNFYEETCNSSETKSNDLHNEEITVTNTANTADFQEPEEIIEVEYENDEKVQNSDEMEKVEVKETETTIEEMVEKSSDLSSLSDTNKQRADALESLLELCAKLLKQEKLEDLAGVLKPFSEERVSSRETAIWLTKSLLKYSSS